MKPVSGYTVKAANYYISVHENLADYKDRLIAAAVVPTTMFIMARVAKVELKPHSGHLKTGSRLTGKQVQAIIDADNGL